MLSVIYQYTTFMNDNPDIMQFANDLDHSLNTILDSSVDCYGVCKCGSGDVLDGSDCDCPQRKGFYLFLEAFYNT